MALASSLHQTYIPLPSSNSDLFQFSYVLSRCQLRASLDFQYYDVMMLFNSSFLAFPDAIYLVDAIRGGKELINACKPALESIYITKVIHDCKRDSEALYYQFGIKLHNVMDTQIAYYLIEEQMGKKSAPDGHISFVRLLGDPCYCGISYVEKKEVRSLLKEDPQFWAYRPLSDLMVRAAADDVRFLPYVFHKMMEKLSEQSLWRLAVRGSLCCRCFCISDNEYADWPAIPSIPDFLNVERDTLEDEILSVLDVPPGKMGCVIGFHHWTPEAGKESRSHVEGLDVVTCEITLFAAPGSQSFYIYNTRLTQAKQTRVKPI
ncbi:hypothetical protein CQW23_11522 [Capsicum baccatum]|uniref:3'-5' exonuclease domain-containing protein n=1 Tax=Capsicum baccatum TaxID=33114 RepID=A0A2G2WPY5_CAPBA|nr:hypothetical protein CQW23_11522 [Capsicum baccatum]